jgi:hypothetical protein
MLEDGEEVSGSRYGDGHVPQFAEELLPLTTGSSFQSYVSLEQKFEAFSFVLWQQ